MKRGKSKQEKPGGEFERRIIIGFITDKNYIHNVLEIVDPIKYLQTRIAKELANWCVEYYRKYQKCIGSDIGDMYMKKLNEGLNPEVGEEIEQDILPSLSQESVDNPISEFLFDQTIEYFQQRQAQLHSEALQVALDKNDMDEFYKLQSTFKSIQTTTNDDKKLNIEELFTMEIKPIEWLIEDLLPKGLTVFGGKSKTGKSYLMLNMVVYLAQGKYMFDDTSTYGYRGDRGHILYLALEDPLNRIQNRMRDVEPAPDLKVLDRYLDIRLSWNKLYHGGIDKLEQWLKERRRPKLIVIDVLEKIAGKSSKTGAGRWYTEEYTVLGPLADLAHRYNTSIIVITHTKKSREADVFDEILGGMGTQGPADNLMVLSRTPDGKRVLAIRGKDIDDIHIQFTVEGEGADWICEGEVDEIMETEERQSLYDYLEMKGWTTYTEIEQAAKDKVIDVSASSVKLILRKMIALGKLEQNKRYGKYAVAGTQSKQANLVVSDKLKKNK